MTNSEGGVGHSMNHKTMRFANVSRNQKDPKIMKYMTSNLKGASRWG